MCKCDTQVNKRESKKIEEEEMCVCAPHTNKRESKRSNMCVTHKQREEKIDVYECAPHK